MRQSTTRRIPSWTVRERSLEARLHPEQVRVEPDPYGPLAALRRGHLERIVAQIHARERIPKVCLYALSTGGQRPRHSLDAAAAFAERESLQVGAGQCFTDDQAPTAPAARPGWCRVRQQIRSGYADGVVVVTASIISRRVDEYRQEIDWIGHYSGFIAVVIPEIQRGLA